MLDAQRDLEHPPQPPTLLCFLSKCQLTKYNSNRRWGAIQWHRSLLGGIELQAAMEEREKVIWAMHLDELPSNETISPTHPLTITSISDLHLFNPSKPAIFRNLSKDTVLASTNMMNDPEIKDIVVDYFADARLVTTVPDSIGPVGEVVRKITGGGPQKVRMDENEDRRGALRVPELIH